MASVTLRRIDDDCGAADTSTTHLSLGIQGMHCASCINRVERALNAVDHVASARVNLATESADVVLMSGDLNNVGNAIRLSAATLVNIKRNLFWAFGYNAILIPLAAGALYPVCGLLRSPVFAAAAMAASSVFVLANALRLRPFRPSRPAAAAAPGSATTEHAS